MPEVRSEGVGKANKEVEEKAIKRQRKAEEELSKWKKKACTMEELEAGPSRVRGAEHEGGAEMMEGAVDILREIRDAMRANNRQFDCLNNLLGRLIKLKAERVYEGWSEEFKENSEVEVEVEELAEELVEMEEEATRA